MNTMLEQFNLPRYIDGLSFADASKKIQSKFKERTDPESINTEKEMLDRLKQMQEHVKAQKEAQEQPERSRGDLVAGSEGMPLDEEEITQEYNQEQGAEEDLMSQIQSAYGGNQYAYGGPGEETPQWKDYMQGQSKMALGGDEEDLHSMPETAKQRFSPVIPANDQSISSSIMSLAKTASSVGADGGDKEETNDFEMGGDPSEYYQNNNPYFTTNPGQINPNVREEGINPQMASQFSSMSGYNPQSNPSPSMGPATSGISDGAGKAAGGSGPGVAGYAQMGATAIELGQEALGPTGVDTSGRSKVVRKKAGNAALAGAAKGASAGMVLGPWGAAAGAVIGGAAGFIGAKKQQKDADIANRNATYADAAVNDNQFAEGGEEDDRIKISDNRKIRATTRQRMDPNVDLVSGSYSSKTITDIVNASLKNGVDPDTAIALAMQESKIGNTDENLGHIVGGSYRGEEANDMTRLLSEKMHAGRKLGRKTDEELLQMYNGTGKIFPSTEQEDHGFKMKKAYGVPVGKKGIDMGKTNLYGIQVKDIRDNVIRKDKKIASIVKDLKGNFNHFEGRPYSKADPRTYDDPLGIAPGARDNLNPKMFALGGEEMNRFDGGGDENKAQAARAKVVAKANKSKSAVKVVPKTSGYGADGKFIKPVISREIDADLMSLIKKDSPEVTGVQAGFEKYYNEQQAKKPKSTFNKVKDAILDNKDALRYAPALGNIMQLAKLKKPEQETTPELSTRYKKNVVDEQGLVNLVREETAGNREAILSSSEGSGNAARANLLGTQLNATKALSDAFMKSQEANARENDQEQSFNLGVDTTNLKQQTLAQDIRAGNKGAYDTEKSRLKTAIGADLGGIGQEELYKKFPELMGLDYDWEGKYKKLKAEVDAKNKK